MIGDNFVNKIVLQTSNPLSKATKSEMKGHFFKHIVLFHGHQSELKDDITEQTSIRRRVLFHKHQ